MGPPPLPYGRSLSQPYQKPLPLAERKKEGSGVHKKPCQDNVAKVSSPAILVPNFSDLSNTFEVEIKRNSLGLGFSISGGPEAPSPWTNLIRVKKIFPLQPAWETGKLKVGDIILRVSGIPLAALTLRQALDILRTSPHLTLLQVCRVMDNSGNSWCAQPQPKTNRSNVVRSYSYGPVSYPSAEGPRSPPKKLSDPTAGGRPPLPHSHTHQDHYFSGHQEQYNPVLHSSTLPNSGRQQRSPSQPRNCPFRPTLSIASGGESMDIEISPPLPSSQASSREWSPTTDDPQNLPEANNLDSLLQDDDNPPDTLNILRPIEATLRNSSSFVGEFTISLTKVNKSLGFTLRQLDDTVLKHTIKALVKEPAISDGRLRPGDKLLAANGVELANFSHQEVITFLRQAPDTNQLTLYRDASRSQTPLTPEHPHLLVSEAISAPPLLEQTRSRLASGGDYKRTSQSPSRKHLRYEAAELVRSLQSSRTSLEKAGLGGGSQPGSYTATGTLGRRLASRPYSPGLREKQSHTPRRDTSPQPRVDSPVTPHNTSAPASLLHQGVTQAFHNMRLDPGGTDDRPGVGGGLVIEEMEGYTSPTDSGNSGQDSPDIQEGISAPQSPIGSQMAGGSVYTGGLGTQSLPRGSSARKYLIGPGSLYDQERRERPNDLNFNNGQNRKQGFVFNNNWNMNKF